jgi:hypothetical protein
MKLKFLGTQNNNSGPWRIEEVTVIVNPFRKLHKLSEKPPVCVSADGLWKEEVDILGDESVLCVTALVHEYSVQTISLLVP